MDNTDHLLLLVDYKKKDDINIINKLSSIVSNIIVDLKKNRNNKLKLISYLNNKVDIEVINNSIILGLPFSIYNSEEISINDIISEQEKRTTQAILNLTQEVFTNTLETAINEAKIIILIWDGKNGIIKDNINNILISHTPFYWVNPINFSIWKCFANTSDGIY